MNNVFSKKLIEYRKKNRYTQKMLAEKLCVSAQAVSKWENGSYPDSELLPKLSKILNVSIDELFGIETNTYNKTDIFSILTENIQRLPANERKSYVMNICYTMLSAYSESSKHTKIPTELSRETFAQLQTNDELSILRLNDDMQYFCFLSIPEKRINSYTKLNDRMIKLFAILSNKDALKIIYFLAGTKRNYLLTKERISNRLKLPLNDVSEIMDTLDKLGLVWELTVDINEKPSSVYGYTHNIPLSMIITLAKSISDYMQYSEPYIDTWTIGEFSNNKDDNK